VTHWYETPEWDAAEATACSWIEVDKGVPAVAVYNAAAKAVAVDRRLLATQIRKLQELELFGLPVVPIADVLALLEADS